MNLKLVEYDDSDSYDDTSDDGRERKRKRSSEPGESPKKVQKLGPSHAFYDKYAIEPRLSTQDDPSLHGGRARSSPHIGGNWPSHVYLEWLPTPAECQNLALIILRVKAVDQTLPITLLHADNLTVSATPRRLHISLSTTLNLATEQRQPFLEQMGKAVNENPFLVRFTRVEWASNYDKSRQFLVLKCKRNPSMSRLLERINLVAASFGQHLLYQNDDMASTLTEPIPEGSDVSSWTSKIGGLNKKNKKKKRKMKKMKRKRKSLSQSGGQEGEELSDEDYPFHVSIASTAHSARGLARQPMDISGVPLIMEKEIEQIRPQFERVKVRIGNEVTSLPLGDPNGDRYIEDNGQRIDVPGWNQITSRPWAVSHHIRDVQQGKGKGKDASPMEEASHSHRDLP